MNFFKYRLARTCFKLVSATLFLCQSSVVIADDSVITTSVGKYTLSVIQISSDAIVERLGSQPGDDAGTAIATLGKLAAENLFSRVRWLFAHGLDSSSIKEAIGISVPVMEKTLPIKAREMRDETNLSGIRSCCCLPDGEGSEDTALSDNPKTETKQR